MKRFLLPAVATLVMAASTAAFAQSGPWYVVFDQRSLSCSAEHGMGSSREQQTVSGPFDSQLSAISAIDGIGMCGGSGTM